MKPLKRRSRPMIIVLLCVMLSVCGCESLAKKFVRKSKKQEKQAQTMVLSPEVYPVSRVDRAVTYRHYMSLWSGWQDELIDSLSDRTMSHRRELESVQEAINNLAEMQKLLSADKQALVSGYMESMNALKSSIAKDLYGNDKEAALKQAESLKRRINSALQYTQVKDALE